MQVLPWGLQCPERYFCRSAVKGNASWGFTFPSLIFSKHTFSESFYLIYLKYDLLLWLNNYPKLTVVKLFILTILLLLLHKQKTKTQFHLSSNFFPQMLSALKERKNSLKNILKMNRVGGGSCIFFNSLLSKLKILSYHSCLKSWKKK